MTEAAQNARTPEELADETDVKKDSDDERTAKQHLTYLPMLLGFLVLPYFVGVLGGGGAAPMMVVLLPVMALVCGLIDGYVFRQTWMYPILLGVTFWLSVKMYYNDAAWIYLLGLVPLCAIGGWLGAKAAS